MFRTTIGILVETTMQEKIIILLITIMGSKDRIDNGISVQIIEVFLQIITTIMPSMWTLISMTIIKVYQMMMAHITMEISK